MKPTHYFKGTGQRLAHIKISFTVTSDEITKMIWYLNYMERIKFEHLQKWSRKKIEDRIRDQFENYGYYAFDSTDFEPYYQDTSHVKKAIAESIAQKLFPEFFETIKVEQS